MLKNVLVEVLDVVKDVDNALSRVIKDLAKVGENAFTQELLDASDPIMTYRRVVHLVDFELKKPYQVPH